MLGDEMGLGKTAQIVATLHKLQSLGVSGPFLIVAPLSTIAHWSREFQTWTRMRTVQLHGSSADRKVLCKYLWAAQASTADGSASHRGRVPGYYFHVVITTVRRRLTQTRSAVKLWPVIPQALLNQVLSVLGCSTRCCRLSIVDCAR